MQKINIQSKIWLLNAKTKDVKTTSSKVFINNNIVKVKYEEAYKE